MDDHFLRFARSALAGIWVREMSTTSYSISRIKCVENQVYRREKMSYYMPIPEDDEADPDIAEVKRQKSGS